MIPEAREIQYGTCKSVSTFTELPFGTTFKIEDGFILREDKTIRALVHSKTRTPVSGNVIPVRDVKLNREQCVFRYFFNTDLCSATSLESFGRDLLNDMAEHRPILKNQQNT